MPWHVSPNAIMSCEQFTTDGKNLAKKLTLQNRLITLIDYEKDTTSIFEATKVQQIRDQKIWSNKIIELVIGIKPSKWGKFFGSSYYTGHLEIKLNKDQSEYISFYCNPEAPKSE
jgi:hypothetical protein